MTTYIVTTSDGTSFALKFSHVHDASPVHVQWDSAEDDQWTATPWQAADVGPSIEAFAKSVLDYFAHVPEDRDIAIVDVTRT